MCCGRMRVILSKLLGLNPKMSSPNLEFACECLKFYRVHLWRLAVKKIKHCKITYIQSLSPHIENSIFRHS